MTAKLLRSFLVIIFFLLASCDIAVQREGTAIAQPLIITATLSASATPQPSETPLPTAPMPTITPVEGTTSTRLNVRVEPSTASDILGIIAANSKVEITGKDIGGNWWQINFDSGIDGKGWVTAQYVETQSGLQVPVVGSGASNPELRNTAIVIQQLNIRSGPGTDFNSIGILNANDVVILTGKNRNGAWLQIEFTLGPDGKGWIASNFVKADNTDELTIVSDTGGMLNTVPSTDTPHPPTPTPAPAQLDFDSADTPLISIIFRADGPKSVLFSGDVSFPEGDIEDWLSITPQKDILFIEVKCMGNKLINIEIIGKATDLYCNEKTQAVPVEVNTPLLIHIQARNSTDQSQYTKYTLKVKMNP